MAEFNPKYPLLWHKGDVYLKIFCSIPQLATGILLKVKETPFVIDPGDGILRDLSSEIGQNGILKIEHIFVTHGHHDHIGGLWALLTYLNVMRKKGTVSIYFPKGCVEIHSIYKAFFEVYSNELSYEIKLVEIKNETKINASEIEILPFKMKHKEKINGLISEVPSLGFKFFCGDVSIFYSGDTAYIEKFEPLVEGSDLAILEAAAGKNENSEMHMTFNEATRLGKKAKEFFIVHTQLEH